MADGPAPKFLSQADFARRRGVSRKAVTGWKSKGLLILDAAGKVDVEETEWKLDQRPPTYRGGVTHRPVRAPDGNSATHAEAKPKTRPKPGNTPAAAPAPRPADGAPDPADFDMDDPNLPLAEAVRRKENFLGLQRKHELEVLRKEWVRVEDVGAEVDRANAVVRGRLLAIPGKMAANLVGLDRAAIDLALFNEISEALRELHAPAAGGGRDQPAP